MSPVRDTVEAPSCSATFPATRRWVIQSSGRSSPVVPVKFGTVTPLTTVSAPPHTNAG